MVEHLLLLMRAITIGGAVSLIGATFTLYFRHGGTTMPKMAGVSYIAALVFIVAVTLGNLGASLRPFEGPVALAAVVAGHKPFIDMIRRHQP